MFAFHRPAGFVVSALATQTTFQTLNRPSPVSSRPALPNRAAIGQVTAIVTTTAASVAAASSRARDVTTASRRGRWGASCEVRILAQGGTGGTENRATPRGYAFQASDEFRAGKVPGACYCQRNRRMASAKLTTRQTV